MFNFPARSRFNTAVTKPLTAQSDIFAANAAVYSTLSQVKEFISETLMGRGTETRTVILERMRFNMAAKTETVFVHCRAQPGSISVNDTVSFLRTIGFTGNTFCFCQAHHCGAFIQKLPPSLQYSSHSRIHTFLYDFFLTCTSRTMPLLLGYSVHNFCF